MGRANLYQLPQRSSQGSSQGRGLQKKLPGIFNLTHANYPSTQSPVWPSEDAHGASWVNQANWHLRFRKHLFAAGKPWLFSCSSLYTHTLLPAVALHYRAAELTPPSACFDANLSYFLSVNCNKIPDRSVWGRKDLFWMEISVPRSTVHHAEGGDVGAASCLSAVKAGPEAGQASPRGQPPPTGTMPSLNSVTS